MDILCNVGLPVFDYKGIVATVSDNPIDLKVYRELQDTIGPEYLAEPVNTFFEEAPAMLSELRAAWAEGNANAFRLASHSLRSNAKIFGASALADQSHALELQDLAADQPVDEATLSTLEETYEGVRHALLVLVDG